MKKHNTRKQAKKLGQTIGLDLGDRTSRYCLLDRAGVILTEGSVAMTKKSLAQQFGSLERSRMALEVGTHSPWVSRHLKALGHEVIVANSRRVRLISESSHKNDKMDARTLARLARVDPELLSPIQHRSEQAQEHLTVIRARAALVEARTRLINTVRGLSKASGERLKSCASGQAGRGLLEQAPAGLQTALNGLLETVETVNQQIGKYDGLIENLAEQHYPESARLQQVSGVGTLIALTFILTIGDPYRFGKSRDVGCYVGLRPRQQDSGQSQPQLSITKEGDRYLRQLLVQGAHYILGRWGPDTDLKRWGLRRCETGGKNAKKRAIVGVARKLAVLLHRLWVSGEVYEPLRNSLARAAGSVA